MPCDIVIKVLSSGVRCWSSVIDMCGQQVLGEGTWFLATQMEQWDPRISCR